MFEHASEPFLASDLAEWFGIFGYGLLLLTVGHRQFAQSLMRPDCVEIGNVSGDDLVEVVLAGGDFEKAAVFRPLGVASGCDKIDTPAARTLLRLANNPYVQ
jgi:hypothetical protein